MERKAVDEVLHDHDFAKSSCARQRRCDRGALPKQPR